MVLNRRAQEPALKKPGEFRSYRLGPPQHSSHIRSFVPHCTPSCAHWLPFSPSAQLLVMERVICSQNSQNRRLYFFTCSKLF